MAMPDLAFHDFADLLPMTSASGIADLAASIATSGLAEPIILFDGKILDGRARYRACRQCGAEPRFEAYQGDDPLGFVVRTNLPRHNLSHDQRAIIAARAAELLENVGHRLAKHKAAPGAGAQRINRRAALADRYREFDALMADAQQVLKEIVLTSAFHVQLEELVRCHLAYLQTTMQEYRAMYVDRPPKTPAEILAARNERGGKQVRARCDRCILFNSEWLATANYTPNLKGHE